MIKVAIHHSKWSFAPDWIEYCKTNGVDYKIVNCYDSDIVDQVRDCNIVFWHHHHTLAKDKIFAQRLLFALQQSGKTVFPNFNTAWHFDDKLGQKYLLEAIEAPMAPTYAFYDKLAAYKWINGTIFPKVFKLRGGAGSTNVKLVRDKNAAKSLVNRAFGNGFPSYDHWGDLKENMRRYSLGKAGFRDILKSIRRLFVGTEFSRTHGREKGYVLFQDFMPDNAYDIRIITIFGKAFGLKRLVRENDFRASGSGYIVYEKAEIDEQCVRLAFETSRKLNAQCIAYDFVFDMHNNPLIIEINYGYAHKSYEKCPGYWDEKLTWHEGKFNSSHWIIEGLIKEKQL